MKDLRRRRAVSEAGGVRSDGRRVDEAGTRKSAANVGMLDSGHNGTPVRAVLLFGPPGSGKGTQAKLLVGRWGIPHISTGDMLRAHLESGDSVGREIGSLMRSGGLVPDAMVNLLVERRVAQPDCRQGFILDGYPRTVAQAKVVLDLFRRKGLSEVVVYLAVDYNVIIARLAGRRQCVSCGALYHVKYNPPKREGTCDFDGEALFTRDDDAEPVIRERLVAYEAKTLPLAAYFRERGSRFLEIVSDSDAPEEICDRIRRAVEEA